MPPLILIPGLVCDAAVWEHQARTLGRSVPVEISDHGLIDSLPGMATAILDSAPKRFAIAGHSMGGRVAFEIVRQAPERIAGVALLDTAFHPLPGGDAGQSERAGRLALLELAKSAGMRAMAWEWVQNMVHPSRLSDKPLIDAILDMIERKSADVFAAQIRALLDRPDATSVLSTIRCPTLVLCGRQDAWSALDRHEEMKAAIPRSTLTVIEECGHMATMERPEAVTSAMQSWLQTIEA